MGGWDMAMGLQAQNERLKEEVKLLRECLDLCPRPPGEAFEGVNDLAIAAFAALERFDEPSTPDPKSI